MFIISLWAWLTINTDIKEKNASKITWLLLPLVAQLRPFLKYRLGLPATPAPTPHAALSLVLFCVFSIPWDRKQPARIAAINGLSWCWRHTKWGLNGTSEKCVDCRGGGGAATRDGEQSRSEGVPAVESHTMLCRLPAPGWARTQQWRCGALHLVSQPRGPGPGVWCWTF